MFSEIPSDGQLDNHAFPKPVTHRVLASNQRRRFLIAASAGAILAGTNLFQPGLGTSIAQSPTGLVGRRSARQGVRLTPNPKSDLFRVRVQVKVEGNVNLAANPLINRTIHSKLPVNSTASFDYEERLCRPSGRTRSATDTTLEDPVTYAQRFYHTATSASQLGKVKQSRDLRQSVKNTIVRREQLPEVVHATEDYFTPDELDLVRLPVSSIGIDDLLPAGEVTVGTTYRPTPQALASALNLTSVDAGQIQAEVVSIDAKEARIQFRGDLDGSVDGVPTMLRTVGKLTFDRTSQVCTWLAMAVHETRDIGIAEPGFDVAATIKVLRKPMVAPVGLESRPADAAVTGPIPTDRLYVDLHSDQIGFSALMDRDWQMMADVPGHAMLRLVRHDRSLAQCDFRSLASLAPGKQWTLEAFTQDVQQTLGQQLTELVDADQRVSPTGLRVLRVSAVGSVQGVPIHWVLMHFSDDAGRRIQATFTLEADQIDAFSGSDLQLASSLQMKSPVDSPDAALSATDPSDTAHLDAAGADSDQQPPVQANALTGSDGKSSSTTRIAKVISRRSQKNEVQSASDLVR